MGNTRAKSNFLEKENSPNHSSDFNHSSNFKNFNSLIQLLCGQPSLIQTGLYRFFEKRRKYLTTFLTNQIFPKINKNVIDFLIKFFSRYYQDGKFNCSHFSYIYSLDSPQFSKKSKETKLRWLHEDQYFVNLSQKYLPYQFQTKHFIVSFVLSRHSRLFQEGKQKGIHRAHILLNHMDYSLQTSKFTFKFDYRPLSPTEYNRLKRSQKVLRITPQHIFNDNLEQIRAFIESKASNFKNELV